MLEGIIKGVVHTPPRIVIYGVHGIGKSTLAAGAPAPIFIPTEEGANEIDVDKLPTCSSHEDVMNALRALYKEAHDYQTAVIDSADWLEDFIHLELKASYTDKELSYGKDSVRAAEKMNEVLTALNHLRTKRNMACIIVAHSEVKRFDSPLTEPYDRYQPKLQSRFSALVQEWADLVGFATWDVVVQKEEVGFNREARRGISTGVRKLYTEERPAFLAKNRYGMPVELTLPDVSQQREGFKVLAQHIPFYPRDEAASEPAEQTRRRKAS